MECDNEKAQGAIRKALKELEAVVGTVEEDATALGDDLGMVSRSPDPQTGNAQPEDGDSCCDIAATLRQRIRELRDVHHKLMDQRNRLDI